MTTELIPMFSQNKTFTTEFRGLKHEYYITGDIGEPEEYIDLCNILRTAGPQDEVILRINSRGGMVSSERMIVNAIQESEATVRAFIEYNCMSAATGIFLAAQIHGWGEHIQFMAHCAWWGAVGKNPDIKSQTEFGLKQMEEEIVSTYSGLLTEQELYQCNDGKEFWFGAKELESRMANYYEYKNEQGCGVDGEDPQEIVTIDQIVEDAVTRALEAYDKKQKALAAKAAKKKPVVKSDE